MPFLSLNNIDVRFSEVKEIIWRNYTSAKVLLITKIVELIDKNEFVMVALNKNVVIFVIYVTILSAIPIYPSKEV